MTKTELSLLSPLMNAAGTLGFFPDLKSPLDLSRLGAFVTNPISWDPRTPAKGDRLLPYPGGFLLHTGYPNPGLRAIIRHHARRWASSPLPVIVHLLTHDAQTLERMTRQLEGKEGVAGVEIGLPPGITPTVAATMTQAALGELAVVARLPFEAAPELVSALGAAGINAISLAPPRGFLPGAAGALVSGRLYGPTILPHALARVKDLLPFGIPVIAAGGIYTERDVRSFLAAGAIAVQLDAVLWQGSLLLKEKA